MHASVMIEIISLRLVLTATALLVILVSFRDVNGQLINASEHGGGNGGDGGGGGGTSFPSLPNQAHPLTSGLLVCPPCEPSDCEFISINGINHPITPFNNRSDILSLANNDSVSNVEAPCANKGGAPFLDDCGCCTICERRPNETCGGEARQLGSCQSGSACWPLVPSKGILLNGSEIGICVELLDVNCATPIESKGCNLHSKRGCVCATISACQAVDFQYGDENECRKDWRKLKAMWQTDCLKAKCNVVFQPHCPPDSVFSPAPPPEPPDCCQKPGVCQCVPDACPNNDALKTCPHGSDLVLTKKATGKPGSCCDIYDCHSRGDECSDIICPAAIERAVEGEESAEGESKINDDDDGDCPADSFRPLTIRGKNRCCPIKDECRCRPGLCLPADCANGRRVIVRKKGSGVPGACCDEFECADESTDGAVDNISENFNTVKRHPTTCHHEGKTYESGDTWRPSACAECKCNGGVKLCRKMECASSSCTRLAVPEGECCPVCIGCTSEDGEVHNVTDEWQKDDCTTCSCEQNGQVLCQKQFCKVECDHPVKVAGECCAKCDKPLIITLPQVCPSIELCPLRCEFGLKRNDRGCFLCECQTDMTSAERDHYDQTSTVEPSHPLLAQHPRRNCSSFDGITCSKKCAHGYEHDATGCPTCKCKGCPPIHQCYKHCLHGFQTNMYGCPICKCKGAKKVESSSSSSSNPESALGRVGSSNSNDLSASSSSSVDLAVCHSMTDGIRDHGEWWFDGCRHCYCDNGLEYCSLVACPPLNCTDPIFHDGECCPRCPGSSQEGLVQRLVCHAPGSGRSYVEGEYWDLEPCVRCTCHIGYVLCHKKLCPPAPCPDPVVPKGQCCPVCEDLRLPDHSASENVSFCQSPSAASAYADGSIWKVTPCESCMCRGSQINCYQQQCPLTGCTGRLLQVKHECCPVCTGNLENGACRFSEAVVYSVGEEWRDGPCRNCSCVGDGETLCTQVECPRCVNSTPIAGQCCPQCIGDDHVNAIEPNWKTWTPSPPSIFETHAPELPGPNNNASPETSLVLLSCFAGLAFVLVIIVLIVCWYRRRKHQNSHQQNGGGFGLLFRRGGGGGGGGGNGGARLTNFPGYDPSKAMPVIVDDRQKYQYEQTKTLLNNAETNEEKSTTKTNGNNNSHHYRPDILLGGGNESIGDDDPYDEQKSRAVQNGTLLYDYEVGGWDVEKV